MKDITNKTKADLNTLIAQKREALRVFRFGTAGAKTKNVKESKGLKKDIARIMTAMQAITVAEIAVKKAEKAVVAVKK